MMPLVARLITCKNMMARVSRGERRRWRVAPCDRQVHLRCSTKQNKLVVGNMALVLPSSRERWRWSVGKFGSVDEHTSGAMTRYDHLVRLPFFKSGMAYARR